MAVMFFFWVLNSIQLKVKVVLCPIDPCPCPLPMLGDSPVVGSVVPDLYVAKGHSINFIIYKPIFGAFRFCASAKQVATVVCDKSIARSGR